MTIGTIANLDTYAAIRAKLNTIINVVDGVTPAADIDVPLANVDGAGTAAAVDTGTGAANVPTITQADARYLRIGEGLQEVQSFVITSSAPVIYFEETDQPADSQVFSVVIANGVWQFSDRDDALAVTSLRARLDPAGTSSPAATTIITKEKGEALFAPISSSETLKDAIAPAEPVDISALARMSWTWGGALPESEARRGRKGSGLIAEQVARVVPEAVIYDDERPIGLDPLTLIGVLIQAHNALAARVDALEAEQAAR